MKQRTARIQERASEYFDKLAAIKKHFATPIIKAKTIKQVAVEKIQKQQLQQQQQRQIKPRKPSISKGATNKRSKKTIQKVESFPVIRPSEAEKHKIPAPGSIVAEFVKQFKLKAKSNRPKAKIVFAPASFILPLK